MQKSRKAVSRTQFLYFFILFFSLYDSNFFGSVPHKGKRDLNTCKDINGNIANMKMWIVLVFSSPFLSLRFEHFFSCLAYFFCCFIKRKYFRATFTYTFFFLRHGKCWKVPLSLYRNLLFRRRVSHQVEHSLRYFTILVWWKLWRGVEGVPQFNEMLLSPHPLAPE